jgi:hypothetical protein
MGFERHEMENSLRRQTRFDKSTMADHIDILHLPSDKVPTILS